VGAMRAGGVACTGEGVEQKPRQWGQDKSESKGGGEAKGMGTVWK
jgi:hypothetical protein